MKVIALERYAIGVDIGGTKLRVGLVDGSFEIQNFYLTQGHQWLSPSELVDLVAAGIREVLWDSRRGDIIGVGVGYPGPVCFPKRSTFSYSNLRDPGWRSVPLADMIGERIGFPVLIDNDANLAGLAELRLGAGKGYRDVVYITISTGTGGAIFINRELYRGFLGSAGEFGHVVVDIHGVECKCGNKGCLMSLLSGLGIERFVQEEPLCRSLFLGDEKDTRDDCVKRLVELLARGVPLALEATRSLVQYLSVAFLNIIHVLNPEAIIVGGTLGKALLSLFFKDVEEYLRMHLPREVVDQTCIVEAELGEQGGVLGAAIAIFESLCVQKG